MAQSFANQVGNIGAIVTAISAVVLFMVLLIAASQMSLAVRERTNEIGALKAMGFGDTPGARADPRRIDGAVPAGRRPWDLGSPG